jgi:ABC-type Mn2+/Zn2+ transport system ATPase subunit
MTNDVAIKAQNLSHFYEKNPVLSDVNFEIKNGDFIGIFGPNGGGKTAH